MKTKHTPGEWRLKMPIINKSSSKISGSGWEDFAKVVVKLKYSDEFDETGLANAKLIAAAPDLLGALIEMVENNVDTHHTHITKAKAAIKKATE